MTLFLDELKALHFNALRYVTGVIGRARIGTANGTVSQFLIWVQIQVLKQDEVTPLTDWIWEQGTILNRPFGPDELRLTGSGIRDHLYFAIAPGNQELYVAVHKNGVVSQLPVV